MEQSAERQSLFGGDGDDGRRNSLPTSPDTETTTPGPRPGWSWLLILAGVVTTVGSSLPVGYNIGVVNSPAGVIKSFCNASISYRYGIAMTANQLEFLWSSIVAIFLVGGTIGSLSGSLFADKIGRRGALIASSCLASMAGTLFFGTKAANSVEMLVIGRLIIGLASGLITSVMPMYLTELAPRNIRGSTGVLCPLGVTFGVLLGQIISLSQVLGNEKYWPQLLAFYLIPLLISGAFFAFLPESPKYLFVIKKEPHRALRELSRIRGVSESLLENEIQELRLEASDNNDTTSACDEEQTSWNIVKVLTDRTLLLPLLLVCSLQAGQQFSGINSVFYYSVSIFQKAGLSLENSQFATIAAGCCNLFMAIVSIPVMARYNRRTTLKLSLATTAFFLSLLGFAILFISKFTWMPYISIAGVLGFVVCYGIALGPIPYFIGSELFEVGPRPSAMALGSMANWGGNFIVGLFFPIMQSCIGAGSFFIFAIIVVALYFFVAFYLPETRGRDPSEVAALCRRGLCSRPLNESSPINSASTVESFPISDLKADTESI